MNSPAFRSSLHAGLATAAVLGILHAVIDAACVALLTQNGTLAATTGGLESDLTQSETAFWSLYLLYNILAFGTQFWIGAIADRWHAYRTAMWLGIVLVLCGVICGRVAPTTAVVLVGFGNAAFHIGAGAIVLRLSPVRAAAAGIFVAPGALGVAIGKWSAQSLPLWPWLAVAALTASAIVVWIVGDPSSDKSCETEDERGPKIVISTRLAYACVIALLASITVRSVGGLAVGTIYTGATAVLWSLALAAMCGKAVGGFVSDGLGWVRTSVVALLVALPLLSVLVTDARAAVIGMFLFQITMPVTLVAVYRVMPTQPGFAFGLTTLALLVGAIPAFTAPVSWITSPPFLAVSMAIAVVALLIGLPPILRTSVEPGE